MLPLNARRLVKLSIVAIALAVSSVACHIPGKSIASNYQNVDQFNFDVTMGPKNYHIEGYLTRSAEQGRRPGLLVLNGGEGNVDQCVKMSQGIAAMGIQVACVSIPGYGNSSGPSRFVGQPSVVASRRALDLLAGRTDVDASRLAVWGLGHGAVAAGLERKNLSARLEAALDRFPALRSKASRQALSFGSIPPLMTASLVRAAI